MRIAMISTPFLSVPPRDYGGTELVIHELTEGLVERGHQVTLFATGDSATAAELRSFYPRAQWPPEMLTDVNHVSWAIQHAASGYDVIHVHSAVALAMHRLLPEVPLVYTLHHERDERLSAFYRHFPEVHYVAISADQKAREIPLPNVTVIHHGLNPDDYRWRKDSDDYVAFVGRLSRVKGPHTAIDVAAQAGREIRVAGDVHDVDREFGSQEVLPRLTLPHVHYLGVVDLDTKAPLLRDARALLVPIEWNEPFGLILIEAMLSGCPVVAFPRGSVPELVEPGVTGFVVESTEEMANVIGPGGVVDTFDRERCRRRAVERFSNDRMVDAHEALYASLAGVSLKGSAPPVIRIA